MIEMCRTYTYEMSRYKFKVVFVGYLMIAMAISFIGIFLYDRENYIYAFGAVISIYGALNTFLFKSNPGKVVVDDETISFVSFGEAKYRIEDIKKFVIKEFANAQFYIRVEDKTGKKGRYWVHYYYFSDREELIDELYYIEKRVHPDSLKFQGRENMFNIRPCYVEDESGKVRDGSVRS